MQVKVFEAEDMASALQKVKVTLGPDALILSTRTVRKKGLGFIGKPVTEITAAVDNSSSFEPADKRYRNILPASKSNADTGQDKKIAYEDLWSNNHILDPLTREIQDLKEQFASANLLSVQAEINELKGCIQNFASKVTDINNKISLQSKTPAGPRSLGPENGWLAPVIDELTRRGIETEAADTIIRLASEKLSPRQMGMPNALDLFFEETIAGLLRVNGPILFQGPNQKRVALIGPTGVGKTTTIAKLAAAYLKNFGRNLALVTIDTYRIAAAEQLRIYGEIMNLPVEVAMTPEQLGEILKKHRDKKLILIDTAGRSPKNEKNLHELSNFLHPDYGIENHLVLSATTRERELYQTIKRFRDLSLKSLIFTKLDECESFGALLNLPAKDKYPLSYLTNGQRVPEDLMLADPKKIACLIMGKPYNRRSTNAINA